MMCQTRFHRGSDAKRLVDAAEVVMHEVKSDCSFVVLNLFLEGISEASETAHRHAHR
jgi:hypothetical protein